MRTSTPASQRFWLRKQQTVPRPAHLTTDVRRAVWYEDYACCEASVLVRQSTLWQIPEVREECLAKGHPAGQRTRGDLGTQRNLYGPPFGDVQRQHLAVPHHHWAGGHRASVPTIDGGTPRLTVGTGTDRGADQVRGRDGQRGQIGLRTGRPS